MTDTNDDNARPADEFLALLDKCRRKVEEWPECYTASPHLYQLQHKIYLRLCGGNIPAHGVKD